MLTKHKALNNMTDFIEVSQKTQFTYDSEEIWSAQVAVLDQ